MFASKNRLRYSRERALLILQNLAILREFTNFCSSKLLGNCHYGRASELVCQPFRGAGGREKAWLSPVAVKPDNLPLSLTTVRVPFSPGPNVAPVGLPYVAFLAKEDEKSRRRISCGSFSFLKIRGSWMFIPKGQGNAMKDAVSHDQDLQKNVKYREWTFARWSCSKGKLVVYFLKYFPGKWWDCQWSWTISVVFQIRAIRYSNTEHSKF